MLGVAPACLTGAALEGYDIVPFGIYDGYQGMIEKRGIELTYQDVDNIIYRGGTILGTARSEAFRTPEGRQKAIEYLREQEIEGLIVIGGDGSFMGAHILGSEMDIPVIGIPGTIDNDIFGTDHTIGYDTALNTVVEAIDKIRDTASSHHRVFFIEVMGRNAGFIALNSAIASGAESVLIPEEVTDLDKLVNQIKTQNKKVRIAFYGDSFVDGDILTSSLRNKLQHRFGGSGVGFVPISSEIAGFRKTIFHKFVNFNSFNIVKSSKLKLPFASGGQLYRPYENNMLSYAGICKKNFSHKVDIR